jgi:dTMP kinase
MALFVTFEGPEGSGKTTQMRLLAEWLAGQGYDVLSTREPGGTRIGDQIRRVLLDPSHTEMDARAEILLFSAARAQLVHQLILPHLEHDGIVLCDRYADSTLAYQGYGLGLDLDMLRAITRFATSALKPDLTFYLDLPVEDGLRRKAAGSQVEWNRMERKTLEYHRRVQQGFLEMARAEPARWVIVDAAQEVESIQEVIRAVVGRKLGHAPRSLPAGA